MNEFTELNEQFGMLNKEIKKYCNKILYNYYIFLKGHIRMVK